MQRTVSTADMRQMREDAAVQAAAQLFLQRGIGAVKMTDIAQTTGIGVASLYRYFTTKTNLRLPQARCCGANSAPVSLRSNLFPSRKTVLPR